MTLGTSLFISGSSFVPVIFLDTLQSCMSDGLRLPLARLTIGKYLTRLLRISMQGPILLILALQVEEAGEY